MLRNRYRFAKWYFEGQLFASSWASVFKVTQINWLHWRLRISFEQFDAFLKLIIGTEVQRVLSQNIIVFHLENY